MSGFGEMLGALRRRDGLSQKELARRAGVSRSAIGMYEAGEREPASRRCRPLPAFSA